MFTEVNGSVCVCPVLPCLRLALLSGARAAELGVPAVSASSRLTKVLTYCAQGCPIVGD